MSDETVTVGAAPQSTFTKAVKIIRGLINKGAVHVKDDKKDGKWRNKAQSRKKDLSAPAKDRTSQPPRPKTIGSVVYLSHLPHGFEEKGIREYLGQFGKINAVKLVRSKKTGRSRGFAFVEFDDREVADIVVETMNNYLMFNRLVKAEHLKPPKDGETTLRVFDSAPIRPEDTISARNRRSFVSKRNRVQGKRAEHRAELKTSRSLRRLQKKLAEKGISYQMEETDGAWLPATETS